MIAPTNGLTIEGATLILGIVVAVFNGIGAAINNKRFNELKMSGVESAAGIRQEFIKTMAELRERIAVLEDRQDRYERRAFNERLAK